MKRLSRAGPNPLRYRSAVRKVEAFANSTVVGLTSGERLELPPFLYLRPGDQLEITKVEQLLSVEKLVHSSEGSHDYVRVYPPYICHETIHLPPHVLAITFRERLSERDWHEAKRLEQFHYRGKGFNRIPGRRTALVLDADGYGVIGYGVLSNTLSSAKPRFELFETTFGEQMRSRLINRLVRISRIVVHPEFRGLGLGVLMAQHLVRYAQEHWDINGYRPIMVEVIASMTEYHRFFQAAGFIDVGRTEGRDRTVMPTYGTGSFGARTNTHDYTFFADGRPKPYLAYPLNDEVAARLAARGLTGTRTRRLVSPNPRLKRSIKIRKVSVAYSASNGLSGRATEVKDAFSVDSAQLTYQVLRRLTLTIEPGDVVLVTGASGSGKSTVLRLLTGELGSSEYGAVIQGEVEGLDSSQVAKLGEDWDREQSLVDQVGRSTAEAIAILNGLGLSEAHLYVKKPTQVSEGQRYRFAMARLCDSAKTIWVADEFASALDPITAAVVAKGIRKLAHKWGATVILAAPHISHFVGSLLPNKLVRLSWGDVATIYATRLRVTPLGHGATRISVENLSSVPIRQLRLCLFLDDGGLRELSASALLRARCRTEPTVLEANQLTRAVALAALSADGVGDIRYVKRRDVVDR